MFPFVGYFLFNHSSGQVKIKPGKKKRGTPNCRRSDDSQSYRSPDCRHRSSPPCYASIHVLLPPHHSLWSHLQYCLFDRAGGVVSKDYDLRKGGDFETFVRIVRRAGCDMDAYELGLDPTVTPLDYLGSVARYPRFKVKVGDNTYHT